MPPQEGLLAGFATGLLCLKAHVENSTGLPVTVLDLSSSDSTGVSAELERTANRIQGQVLFGITTTTASYRAALAAARELKRLMGDRAIIMFGGHHASADAATVLRSHPDVVDFIVAGEGEAPLLDFVVRWPDVERIPGLCFLQGDGSLRCNAPPPPLDGEILDTLTLDPRWFRGSHEPGKFNRYTYVSARGCPLRCRFCSVANTAIRGKSAAVVSREISQIVSAGFSRIAIEDNFFGHSPKRTNEICEALRQLRRDGLEFSWDCQTRVEAVSRSGAALLLKEAGCDEVYLGVEALDANALAFLGKAPNADRYFRQLRDIAIPQLLSHGLRININIQCGLPPEARSDTKELLARLREAAALPASLGRPLQIFPQLFVVYPGTSHFSEFCESGVLWPEIFEAFVEWEQHDQDFIGWLGRNFAHGVGGIPLGILDRERLIDRSFVIDWRLAAAAERLREDMASLPGAAVFNYDNYLVRNDGEIVCDTWVGAI